MPPVDAALAGWVDRHASWSERTETFTTRRELAATTGVTIVNLGSPLEIADAGGAFCRAKLPAAPTCRPRRCGPSSSRRAAE